ncbi:Pulmonary surfactant-associated protein A, partial [Eudyptula minor novaehollandiae]
MLSPQLFHKIFGAAFFLLLCCAQGKPPGIPPLPSFVRLPEYDEGFIPGTCSYRLHFYLDVLSCSIAMLCKLSAMLPLLGKTASGGKIFATTGEKADFQTTLKKCKEVGGSIATPRNPGENDAILYFVKKFNAYAYLGIKESLIPSNFQFLDGTQLSYTNWHLSEPSGKGKEACVEMYTDGTWNDKKCNQNRLIVCQF